MDKASQDLINEHKAILIVLSVIEKMYQRVQDNKELDFKDIENIIEFLKVFADTCHHGKEENFLFPSLEKVGVKNQDGPIGLMLAQHQQGRKLIGQMQKSIENKTINKQAFTYAASSYVSLLRNHIEKENKMLFPMSDTKLPESIQKKLLNDFENIEKNVIGEGKHEELHILLKKLERKFL